MNSNIELSEMVSEYLRAAEAGHPNESIEEDEIPDPTQPTLTAAGFFYEWTPAITAPTATTTATATWTYSGSWVVPSQNTLDSAFIKKMKELINKK